ncbi:nuclear speckle splicing regulatory protein 1 [Zerene cesonia]|uniref:nuclear speckle splicing regulatory protein 1 n=1 Tax=Zerene cesonia TaxID=33412 RepID=UPI0018E52AD7|nr:nuclear speckle splicing regulatory protein 1 [Zerene cesonia]
MSTNKKYGLILPETSKAQPTFKASHNVFGNDSDSDEDTKKKPVLLRPSDNIKRQTRIAQEKAILEDPTVYQYDEIYDSMVIQKESKDVKTKEEKKPKYIENLLKTANKRKIENERRVERQIQKEREKEGEEFADKEVFVTSAYKKKLEELRLEEEKEKREEYLEKIGDVTKQQDLGGFYRHLYEQKLGSSKQDKELITAEEEKDSVFKSSNKKDNSDLSNKRNYRKRKSSHELKSDGEIEDSDDEVNRNCLVKKKSKKAYENIDADSDFSIDESSDEESKPKNQNSEKESEDTFKKPSAKVDKLEAPNNVSDDISKVPKIKEKEIKPKIDIWKKRTVGEVFEEALQRYYQRKSARGA